MTRDEKNAYSAFVVLVCLGLTLILWAVTTLLNT